MLIEVLQESDIDIVEDVSLKAYLDYSLKRLPVDFNYFENVEEYGYFVLLTEIDDLLASSVELRYFNLPSIVSEEFSEQVELIESKVFVGVKVFEILFRVDTDISVSLILRENILDDVVLGFIEEFIGNKCRTMKK